MTYRNNMEIKWVDITHFLFATESNKSGNGSYYTAITTLPQYQVAPAQIEFEESNVRNITSISSGCYYILSNSVIPIVLYSF